MIQVSREEADLLNSRCDSIAEVGRKKMKWITREHVKVDRVACPRLIRQWRRSDNTLWQQPEGAGLSAIAEGFRHLNFKNDHEINAAEWIVYDALYEYCKEMIKRGKPNGAFR